MGPLQLEAVAEEGAGRERVAEAYLQEGVTWVHGEGWRGRPPLSHSQTGRVLSSWRASGRLLLLLL